MLTIDHVTKRYRRGVLANDGITLDVRPGEVFGLLGPNGAGKTTLVSQIVGLVTPTSGTIRIGDIDVAQHPDAGREACSWQPQSQVPINALTPLEAIELVGRIRGVSATAARDRAARLLQALDIGDWSRKRGSTLSGGVGRLVAFAMAAVVPGDVVVLDEPTNDVDPLRRRLLWDQVTELASGGSAVLLVTHNVLEAERVVDGLAVLDHGRVVASGTPGSLKTDSADRFRLEVIFEPGEAVREVPAFVLRPLRSGRRLLADVEARDIDAAVRWARDEKDRGTVEEFSIGPTTLEDTYVRLVDHRLEEAS